MNADEEYSLAVMRDTISRHEQEKADLYRLVEEAQGELRTSREATSKAMVSLGIVEQRGKLLMAERDRLKSELAQFDALSVRLAKELAEARQLIAEVGTLDCFYSGGKCAPGCDCLSARSEHIASPPVEQAQPSDEDYCARPGCGMTRGWHKTSNAGGHETKLVRAELNATSAVLKDMTEKRDRLKGELVASKFRNDALESLIDTERQSRKEAENTLFFVRKELQKLKGELKTMTVMWQALVDNAPKLHGEIKRLKGELAKEQEAHREASKASHHWEEVATNLREENTSIKGELAEARRLIASAPIGGSESAIVAWVKARASHLAATPAEQAQGEAPCSCDHPDHGKCACRCHRTDPVAALAKRVKALESFRKEVESWTDAYRTMSLIAPAAPPPPEAAGPGHVFVGQRFEEGIEWTCARCGKSFDDHDVPPEAAGPQVSCVAHEDCDAADRHSRGAANHVHEEPESAGPGHAYEEPSPGDNTCCAHVGVGPGTYVRCARPRSDHAVPPITGSGK